MSDAPLNMGIRGLVPTTLSLSRPGEGTDYAHPIMVWKTLSAQRQFQLRETCSPDSKRHFQSWDTFSWDNFSLENLSTLGVRDTFSPEKVSASRHFQPWETFSPEKLSTQGVKDTFSPEKLSASRNFQPRETFSLEKLSASTQATRQFQPQNAHSLGN